MIGLKKAFLQDRMKIVVKDVPRPRPLQGQVLVRVRACSICGTDLHSYRLGEKELLARVPEGQTKSTLGFYGAIGSLRGGGHQIAGDILEQGPDASKWSIGDRVAGVAASGYAEYCNMERIYRLPDALT